MWKLPGQTLSPEEERAASLHANSIFPNPTGSIIPHVLLYVVQVIALICPSFRYRRILFSALILSLAALSMIEPHFTNNIGLAQPFTVSWSYYLSTLAKILFSSGSGPEASFWRIDKPQGEALSYTGIRKLSWALVLIFNTRGIRWNYQVKNIPGQFSVRRSRFIFQQTLLLLRNLVLADLFSNLSVRLFYTDPSGSSLPVDSKFLSLGHENWGWSFVRSFTFGATPYYILSTQYALFSILAVLLGFSEPKASHWILRNAKIGDE
jgi:hypothetical protein